MKQIECVRCQTQMKFVAREKIQLGQTGFFFGDLPNLLAGALEVDICTCPVCGKYEFFQPDDKRTAEFTAGKVKCPSCGMEYETHLKECPVCGHSRR